MSQNGTPLSQRVQPSPALPRGELGRFPPSMGAGQGMRRGRAAPTPAAYHHSRYRLHRRCQLTRRRRRRRRRLTRTLTITLARNPDNGPAAPGTPGTPGSTASLHDHGRGSPGGSPPGSPGDGGGGGGGGDDGFGGGDPAMPADDGEFKGHTSTQLPALAPSLLPEFEPMSPTAYSNLNPSTYPAGNGLGDAVIWGTNVNVATAMTMFKSFIQEYRQEAGEEGGEVRHE